MSELNIELTKAELVEPARHKDRIRKVFLLILEACGGITEEDLKQISPRMRETLQNICQYPQIHEEFESVRFFWHLKKFMAVCGVMDFGWKDLIIPTAKRFRVQLSAAINMAKFREDQLKLYVELNEPVSKT
jgi:Nuf2 family